MKVKCLSDKATLPTKGSPESAGFDTSSAEDTVIKSGEYYKVHADLAIEIPNGHFGLLKSLSGLSLKKRINVRA